MARPLRRNIRRFSWSGNIPAFIHIDLNDVCDCLYDWRKVRQTIIEECGWIGPSDDKKALHTSCKTEKMENCTSCHRCSMVCPNQTIQDGKVSHCYIRCLHCYQECPNRVLIVEYILLFKWYLKYQNKKQNLIYV